MEAGCGNPQYAGGLQSLRRVGIRWRRTVTRLEGAAEEEKQCLIFHSTKDN